MRCFRGRAVALVAASTIARVQYRYTGDGALGAKGAAGNGTKAPPAATQSGTVLPGEDLARRAVAPNQDFPATWSADEPLDPSDPRVVWREHYSVAEGKPYYQNVNTNDVTYTIPEGFVTRFRDLHVKAGYRVDEHDAVFATADARPPTGGVRGTPKEEVSNTKAEGQAEEVTAGATADKGSGTQNLLLKQKLAAYGGGGLLWYLIVHNVSLLGVFTCLYVFRIDLVSIAISYGFKINQADKVEEISDETKRPPLVRTFILSIVLNKILVPLHLLITVATAPFLVHRLEPVAAWILPKIRAIVDSVKAKFTASKAVTA